MTDQYITLTVLAGVVIALAYLRSNPDLILSGGLAILVVLGVIEPAAALHGFSNEGLVTVALLFVVAEGLRLTGGINFLGQTLLGQPKSLSSAQMRIMLPAALMSAFLNNTPVVAMMMPVVGDWAKKLRLSVSKLLLPLSYAAILGGMCTLIGTSTTLVVNGLLIGEMAKVDEPPTQLGLTMFEIAWVGVPSMILGLIYVLVSSRWLLPDRKPAITPLDDPREYTVEMIVEPSSPLVGKTIEGAGLRQLTGMYLMEIDRRGHIMAAVPPETHIEAGDRLVFVGVVESVIDLRKIPGLQPATDQLFKLDGERTDRCLIEAVVSDSCPFIRMTIRLARFRSHYNAAVIAVARNGQRLRKKVGDIELLPGDTLLVEANPSFLESQRNSRDFFLVSRVEDSIPPRHEQAWVARLLLLAMVVVVSTGVWTMLEAAMVTAGLMILARCCTSAEAKQSLDWSVLLVIGAGLGIGEAMQQSGAASGLASGLVSVAGDSPRLVLTVIYGVTMLLTNVITAKAAAVLIFPVAMEAASLMNVDILPFAIAVMMAAAASFATPIGYQTNLMVYGPGGYRYGDFFRLGGPLTLLVWAVTVGLAPIFWPF